MSFNNVLITGGAGFFGRAMAAHLLSNGADRVCIYSRDEYKQAVMSQKFNNDKLRFFIGDVQDHFRFRRAIRGVELVIHAAAMKRIDACHFNPEEMVRINVLGTANVVNSCESAGIRCVFLSTDKACEPISSYGYSKALAERIAFGAGAAVTRYGNVANSTGSVIPKWKNCGTVVPVTDPEATRFFMLPQEAINLVLYAAEHMPKDVVVPNLPAYDLRSLAEAMWKEIRVTGLPEWEKKHESMVPGQPSNMARRMTVEELREEIGKL